MTLRAPSGGGVIDRALVLRFDGPASATGEDVVEYQCHGGRAVVDALLDAMTSLPGMRLAEPGEFTRRALTNGRIAASGGAAPVFRGDEMIGAYGISGGTSQQDEEMAVHARAKVGWAHQPQNDTTDAAVKAHVNDLYAQAGITDRKL